MERFFPDRYYCDLPLEFYSDMVTCNSEVINEFNFPVQYVDEVLKGKDKGYGEIHKIATSNVEYSKPRR